jgi:transposase
VIVTAPESVRDELRQLPVGQLIRRCSRFRRSASRTPDELAIVLALRSLARRIEAATAEAADLEHEIFTTSARSCPSCSTKPASARSSLRK